MHGLKPIDAVGASALRTVGVAGRRVFAVRGRRTHIFNLWRMHFINFCPASYQKQCPMTAIYQLPLSRQDVELPEISASVNDICAASRIRTAERLPTYPWGNRRVRRVDFAELNHLVCTQSTRSDCGASKPSISTGLLQSVDAPETRTPARENIRRVASPYGPGDILSGSCSTLRNGCTVRTVAGPAACT